MPDLIRWKVLGGLFWVVKCSSRAAVKVCEVVKKTSCEAIFVKSACREVRSVIFFRDSVLMGW